METMENYIKEHHPEIAEEYRRYLNREQLPEIGDKVKTLCMGFGGPAGLILTVTEIDDKYITVTDGNNDYIATIEIWYKQIKRC